MENRELAEIDASARAIVRRAYDLGRNEALKRVVEVLKDENPSADRLALMAPEQTVTSPTTGTREAALNGAASSERPPWWAWPVR